MTDRTDAMAQALFNKPTLEACSLQQVDYLAHQYPYFSAAQLLLLQKSETGTEAYNAQLQRTALHFSNPMQLHYALQPRLFETDLPGAQLFQMPMPAEELQAVEEESAALEEVTTEESTKETEQPVTLLSETLPAVELATVEEAVGERAAENGFVAEPVQVTPMPEMPAPVESGLSKSAAAPEAPVIAFEPFHTVDYFASQGIKLSQQEATSDHLGKQLKSFTEWLKTMKRLPSAAAPQPTDAAGERNAEHLAAHSLDTTDVVTESMAEVWLKQGATDKAADVYRKLSLRNPSKSAYFAAKIESLKHTNA